MLPPSWFSSLPLWSLGASLLLFSGGSGGTEGSSFVGSVGSSPAGCDTGSEGWELVGDDGLLGSGSADGDGLGVGLRDGVRVTGSALRCGVVRTSWSSGVLVG